MLYNWVLGLGKILVCLWFSSSSWCQTNWAVWIVSLCPLDLSVRFKILFISRSHSLPLSGIASYSLQAQVSLPLLMFLLSLFPPPPWKCRNPSAAFYQAFRPSRLLGSKPINDRYELGCVYMCYVSVCVAWHGWLKLDSAPLHKEMSTLTCFFWRVIA